MKYRLITTNEELSDICNSITNHSSIAIDTEFTRRKTFYPILGLIQLGIDNEIVLIDPLQITQWQPFKALLACDVTPKFFHACSEDFDVFKYYFGLLPQNYLDTQIIAPFVGYPLSIGLATLVKHYLGITLDKSECQTDWLKRPLSDTQCHYAASDVLYLPDLVDNLLNQLQKTPWEEAVKQELQSYYMKRIAEFPDEKAYLNIKNAWQLSKRSLACLQKLATWRIRQAKQQNMAVNFVIPEDILWKIAKCTPSSLSQLSELGVSASIIRRYGHSLLTCVTQGMSLAIVNCPETILRVIDLPNYKKNFNAINTIVSETAQKLALPKELLASRKQINQLLLWQSGVRDSIPDILSGWRGELLINLLAQ